jgi:PBP1b-binding outer membrane lipoprotein LpoB
MNKQVMAIVFLIVTMSFVLVSGCNMLTASSPSANQSPPSDTTNSQSTNSSIQTATPDRAVTTPSSTNIPSVALPGFGDLLDVVEHSVVKIDVVSTSTNIFGQSSSQQGAGSGWL